MKSSQPFRSRTFAGKLAKRAILTQHLLALVQAVLCSIVVLSLSPSGLADSPIKQQNDKPLLKRLSLFTAPGVPDMGPAETEVAPLEIPSRSRRVFPAKALLNIPCFTWARAITR